jgi:predicted nuclease with TOPRIM domain
MKENKCITSLSNNDKSKILLNITEKYKNCIDGYNTIKEKNKMLKSKYSNIINQCKEVQSICLNQLKMMKSYEQEIHKLTQENHKLNQVNQTLKLKVSKLESAALCDNTLELGSSSYGLSAQTEDNDFNISGFQQPQYLDSDEE